MTKLFSPSESYLQGQSKSHISKGKKRRENFCIQTKQFQILKRNGICSSVPPECLQKLEIHNLEFWQVNKQQRLQLCIDIANLHGQAMDRWDELIWLKKIINIAVNTISAENLTGNTVNGCNAFIGQCYCHLASIQFQKCKTRSEFDSIQQFYFKGTLSRLVVPKM